MCFSGVLILLRHARAVCAGAVRDANRTMHEAGVAFEAAGWFAHISCWFCGSLAVRALPDPSTDVSTAPGGELRRAGQPWTPVGFGMTEAASGRECELIQAAPPWASQLHQHARPLET
jgi:hypothetical protein